MKKLLISAWIVVALNLVILALMIRALATAEFGDADRDDAVSMTWTLGFWICAVNFALVVGWWRESRVWLWVALVGGGLPLLRAWTLLVEAITGAASGS